MDPLHITHNEPHLRHVTIVSKLTHPTHRPHSKFVTVCVCHLSVPKGVPKAIPKSCTKRCTQNLLTKWLMAAPCPSVQVWCCSRTKICCRIFVLWWIFPLLWRFLSSRSAILLLCLILALGPSLFCCCGEDKWPCSGLVVVDEWWGRERPMIKWLVHRIWCLQEDEGKWPWIVLHYWQWNKMVSYKLFTCANI